jgi:hypothetical protein
LSLTEGGEIIITNGGDMIITDGGASLDSSVCGMVETTKKGKNAIRRNAKGIIKNATKINKKDVH